MTSDRTVDVLIFGAGMGGMSAALAPNAILRDAFTDTPRASSLLDSAPPHSEPTPLAAYGIQPIAPAVLMSRWNASNRYFGSQKR